MVQNDGGREEEEEILYSCRMIVVDIYFLERSVEVTQETAQGVTKSSPLIVTLKTRLGALSKCEISIGETRGLTCPKG